MKTKWGFYMKYYRNNKIFDYEHYITESTSSGFFPKMLSILSWLLAIICVLLVLFLFLSPASNNFILKDHIRHQNNDIKLSNFRGNQ